MGKLSIITSKEEGGGSSDEERLLSADRKREKGREGGVKYKAKMQAMQSWNRRAGSTGTQHANAWFNTSCCRI